MQTQKIVPHKGMNLDIDEAYMPSDVARFIKGWQVMLNENSSSDLDSGKEGANVLAFTKDQANEQFANITLPPGVNKSIRGGYVHETGKYYSFLWNSLDNHSIWQLDATNRTITKVIQNSCLGFIYDPEHFIAHTRFTYTVYSVINYLGVEEPRTWIFFCDNNSRDKQIQVEDCIATNGLTHSFFNGGTCCSVCDMITMGFPSRPMGCIGISPVSRPDTDEERAKPNPLNFKVWQWRLKAIDAWGRQSFHGDISAQYFNSKGTSCAEEDSFPRCVDLSFDAGCAINACLVLEYRTCDKIDSDWKEHDTICRYSDCDADNNFIENFWERTIKKDFLSAISDENPINYDPETNIITYRFCGNKECKAIPKAETSLLTNYIPNKSNSIFKIGNKIGTADNEYGFAPLDCGMKDNIVVSLEDGSECNPFKFRKVTIWGYIYSPLDNCTTNIRYVKKSNGESVVAYGVIGNQYGMWETPKKSPVFYEQYMGVGVEGFVMSARGHDDIVSVCKQFDISAGKDNAVFIGPGTIKEKGNRNTILRWDFYIPAGKYVFDIHNPIYGLKNDDDIGTAFFGYYKQSSADFIGLTSINNPGQLVTEQYELHIDCCEGDVEIFDNPVMIWDLTRDVTPDGVSNFPNIVKGILVDTNAPTVPFVAPGKYCVELAIVLPLIAGTTPYYSLRTNANGHFFMTCKGTALGNQLQAQLISTGCITGTVNSAISDGTNEYQSGIVHMAVETFQIKGKYLSCENEPLAGVVIVYQNGGFAITASDGTYTIYAHGAPSSRPLDKLVIANQVGGCLRTRCDDPCDACFDLIDITPPPCGDGRILDIGIELLNSSENVFQRGLMKGKYGVGTVFTDCLTETFVQGDEKNYVEVVDINLINQISFNLTGLQVNPKFKSMSFYVTENLTYEKWLEWAVDFAVLEDNNGNIGDGYNVVDPTRIRIYIQSLIYYTAYGNTNTGWQFLPGDLIEILSLGNGDVSGITKLVSYREGDSYVTMEYDKDSMEDFLNNDTGSIILLLRPRTCETSELYYQICDKIDITNGIPNTLTGTVNYSNLFKFQRSIPIYGHDFQIQSVSENIYNTDGKIVGTFMVDKTICVASNTNNKVTYLMHHHSPSDFFGDYCWGKGRVNIKNPFEKVVRLKTEISIGKGISEEGNVNYQHWFEKKDAINFIDEQTYSSITGVSAQQNILLVITPTDCFTIMYNQNEFTIQNGRVLANVPENKFGKPQSKIGDEYGCQQWDINTIFYKNGVVGFLDSRRGAIIKHNFNTAEDVTPFGIKGWLLDKIKTVELNNISDDSDSGKKFFHAIICPLRNNDFILTQFKINVADSDYINNSRQMNLAQNETVVVNLDTKLFRHSLHYTPEMFGSIETALMGQQLISFKGGVPYIHYPLLDTSNVYLNFYGVQCKPVLEVIFNLENKNKDFFWVETYIKQHQLYIDRIITESGQESRIMPLWWNRQNNIWVAPFLCQSNGQVDPNLPNNSGINAIMDGSTLFGKWAKVRFVTKDDDDSKYGELISVSAFFEILKK